MLYDPARHETRRSIPWDEVRVRRAIADIVQDTEARFEPDRYWPVHPLDIDGDEDPAQAVTPLYHGACGVIWALHHLQSVGAARLSRSYAGELDRLLEHNRAWLAANECRDFGSFLMGDTPILLLAQAMQPTAQRAERLAALISANMDHPARELMWGSPGTMLAALFLHEHTGEERWAELFRATAARLWSQLQWSTQHACSHWIQDLYGQHSTYLDAVHGFVATALPLIRGRHLFEARIWADWNDCIVNTVERTVTRDGVQANWRPLLDPPQGRSVPMLVQFCHGAPGFVVCLAHLPGTSLDPLLSAAGETVWAAGPLKKGSNLCHGTGGNGFAFLKLFRRTGHPQWLERARGFAMHGIEQWQADTAKYRQMRYSLWTGDPGFAIYLWHCLQGTADFPTLDVY